jgi:fructose-1,6-bisphosphatase I
MNETQKKVVTIERHIINEERKHPSATGEFSNLLRDITLAVKIVQREVSFAGLVDIIGFTGSKNVHGEAVKKLDIYANDKIIQSMTQGGHFAALASEENEDIVLIPESSKWAKYIMLFDPLDGSSNIDVNINIGTIFSIYKRLSSLGTEPTIADFLQPGKKLLAAGYVIYGPSTVLVYSSGHGVHAFTLDPGIGEFLLSYNNLQIPLKGNIYSVNEGNYNLWSAKLKQYIDYIKNPDHNQYSLRYIGSLVADFHRTLMYGGIFLYPADNKNPKGKLRLLYELNPLAFLIGQAGGIATTGDGNIMDVVPEELHQRSPVFMGSKENINELKSFLE